MKINGHDISAEPAAVPVGEVPKLGRLLTPEEAATLRALVKGCIEQHINKRTLKQTAKIEAAERETLETITRQVEW